MSFLQQTLDWNDSEYIKHLKRDKDRVGWIIDIPITVHVKPSFNIC